MRLINSHVLDRFFFYSLHHSSLFKQLLTFHEIGNFVYYDCDEIRENLKPKAREYFDEFIERNKMEVHEYGE